jgi:hypothetical protein
MQNKRILMLIATNVAVIIAAFLFVNFDTPEEIDVNTTVISNTVTTTINKPETTTTTEETFTVSETETTVVTTTKPVVVTRSETTEKKEVQTTQEETTVSSVSKGIYTIPDNGGRFKSYTNYRLLSKSSPQWNKIQCHENAYTDENGLRKVGDYYCVAMGSYYSSTLGDTFEVTTEGGTFRVVLCDFKANQHTDSTNRYTAHNGCVIEFYVDMDSLDSAARRMGDISYADSKFSGKITSITKTGNILN